MYRAYLLAAGLTAAMAGATVATTASAAASDHGGRPACERGSICGYRIVRHDDYGPHRHYGNWCPHRRAVAHHDDDHHWRHRIYRQHAHGYGYWRDRHGYAPYHYSHHPVRYAEPVVVVRHVPVPVHVPVVQRKVVVVERPTVIERRVTYIVHKPAPVVREVHTHAFAPPVHHGFRSHWLDADYDGAW